MNLLDSIAPACGVIIRLAGNSFEHLGTAWSVGPGEWVTAWNHEEPPGDHVRLMSVDNGTVASLENWECEDGIAGFTSMKSAASLPVERDAELAKRMSLVAVGYPSMIDHPAFRLHRGSLDPARYLPYLCPWTINGHVGLFTAQDGYLTGRFYAGMAGAPVLDDQRRVVGVLLDGDVTTDHPALTRFRRLA